MVAGSKVDFETPKGLIGRVLDAKGIDWQGGKKFTCLSGTHPDRNPSMNYYEPGGVGKVHCSQCGADMDTIDIIQVETGMTKADAVAYVIKTYGAGVKVESKPAAKPKTKPSDYRNYLADCWAAYSGSAGDAYMIGRGISTKTAEQHGIGFDAYRQRVTFPLFGGGYTARIIDDSLITTQNPKYKNSPLSKGEERGFFPQGWRANMQQKPVWPLPVVEGEMDALSLLEIGCQAVATGGVGGFKNFVAELISLRAEGVALPPLILIPDNDEPAAGQKHGTGVLKMMEMAASLDAAGIGYCFMMDADGKVFDILQGAHDVNTALVEDRAGLRERMADALAYAPIHVDKKRQAAPTEPAPAEPLPEKWDKGGYDAEYGVADIVAKITHERENGSAAEPIPTVFANLNAELGGGLTAGLMVIGAPPSAGKTAIVLQVADGVAEWMAKTDPALRTVEGVMYFGYEIPPPKVVARSLSREATYLFQREPVPVQGITRGWWYDKAVHEKHTLTEREKERITKATARYKEYCGKMFVVKASPRDFDINKIREAIERHRDVHGKPPVVFVDYLQLIAKSEPRQSDKERIDEAIYTLQGMAVEFQIPIVVISSLNRAGYYKSAGVELFKESGAIEHAAEVLIILSYILEGVKGDESDAEIKEKIKTEMRKKTRFLRATLVKNREGDPYVDIDFKYHSMGNLFIELKPEA